MGRLCDGRLVIGLFMGRAPAFVLGGTAMLGALVCAGAGWPGYRAGRNTAVSPLATHARVFNAVDCVTWIQQWGGFGQY